MGTSRRYGARLAGFLVAAGALLINAGAAAQPPSEPERLASINLGLQLISDAFMNASPYTLHGEVGKFDVHYDFTKAIALDGGLAFHVAKRFGLGFAVSYVDKPTTARIDATVPHPFFFAFPRSTRGTARGLNRREIGLHLQPQYWQTLFDTLLVRLFAGPTIFLLRQELVSGITTNEIGFTFDHVRLVGHQSRGTGAVTLGLNAGFDGSYFLTDRVGVGFGFRYSRGTDAIDLSGRASTPVEFGGTHFGGGLRVAF